MSPTTPYRTAPALLPGVRNRGFRLTLIMALLSFVAAVEIMAVAAAIQALRDWPGRLAGSVTLSTPGHGLETADAAAARAAEILSRDPRVAKAWILEPSPDDAVAARIMGGTAAGPDNAPPRLVGVASKAGAEITAAAVLSLMGAQGVSAVADDHGWWSGPLERAALLAAAAAAALLLVLLALVAVLTGWGVRGAFARNRPRVTLLLHLGATDKTLLAPIRGRLTGAAILGTTLGILVAFGLGAILVWSPAAAIWLTAQGVLVPPLDVLDLEATLAWLPAAALIAVLAAGVAAKAALKSLNSGAPS